MRWVVFLVSICQCLNPDVSSTNGRCGSKIGSIQLTACLAEKAMEPIEWLIIGHQIYKGLKFPGLFLC